MSWYNGNWKRRIPVTINASTSGSGTYDLEVTIPVDWDDFWDNTRSDGNDIVLTDADGTSILDFQFKAGFNLTNRSLTLQARNVVLSTANVMRVVQLYYDYSGQTTSLQTSFSIGSFLVGYVYLGSPSGFVVKDVGFRPIGTVPVSVFQKDIDDQIDIWFPVGAALAKRRIEYNQKLDFKLPRRFGLQVKNSSKVNQTAMYALEETRLINGWCRVRIKAGSDNTDYTVRLGMTTTDSEAIVFSCLLQVRELTAQ